MKKPRAGAPGHVWNRYREWVKRQLRDWDPRDDHFPDAYHPRCDGVRGDEVEVFGDGD